MLAVSLLICLTRDHCNVAANKEPAIQIRHHTHIYRPRLSPALPASPVCSALPASSRPYEHSHSGFWTSVRKQCQSCYPERPEINGKNLASPLPQVSRSKLSLLPSCTMRALCARCGAEGDPCLRVSLCFSFRPCFRLCFLTCVYAF